MEPDVLLRQIDAIHRDKNIDKEVLFQGIENALASAAKKRLRTKTMPVVRIDRESGEIRAFDGDEEIDPAELGRIAAQTAKQIIVQKIREAERDSIVHDFEARKGEIITGSVLRLERGDTIVGLGRAEAILPASEQIPGDTYRPGEHMRAMLLDVRRTGSSIRVILSRTRPDFVRHLFELEVPEVRDGAVEIKGIAREPGRRTKIAVHSHSPKIDAVGACVGMRGTRIKSIVEELNGEKIDIIRWSDDRQELIANALKPAEVAAIEFVEEENRAGVRVTKDQLSLALGKKGQNVRLAGRLANCSIDIIALEEEEDVAAEGEPPREAPVEMAVSPGQESSPEPAEEKESTPELECEAAAEDSPCAEEKPCGSEESGTAAEEEPEVNC